MFIKFIKEKEEIKIRPNRIFCLTSNYREHIKEMGKEKDSPALFIKPLSALVLAEGKMERIPKPDFAKLLHHEVEITLLFTGEEIGYGVGLDLTLRDLQKELKEKGKPWFLAKGFDSSGPISNFYEIKNEKDLKIKLFVNGVLRQEGSFKEMILKPREITKFISQFIPLKKGDIIFTGTPSGIGELKKGDIAEAALFEKDKKITSFQVKIT
ncbi:MAG: fumarylacetoacetate hydrolase family protein [Thermoanaerobaculia bacterium]